MVKMCPDMRHPAIGPIEGLSTRRSVWQRDNTFIVVLGVRSFALGVRGFASGLDAKDTRQMSIIPTK